MRFTEHELTAALTGAAKSVLVARPGTIRRRRARSVDDAWEALGRYERFQLLDTLGSQVLPVLVALPDVEVAPGTRASYDDRVVSEVVASLVDDGVGRVRRAMAVKARTALVQVALSHVPVRPGPGGQAGGFGGVAGDGPGM